jgi:hypothetical protein
MVFLLKPNRWGFVVQGISGLEGGAMKTTLVMPREQHKLLLAKCEPTQPEYEWLVNGIILTDHKVQISCDSEQATLIMAFATRECPDVRPYIRVRP